MWRLDARMSGIAGHPVAVKDGRSDLLFVGRGMEDVQEILSAWNAGLSTCETVFTRIGVVSETFYVDGSRLTKERLNELLSLAGESGRTE